MFPGPGAQIYRNEAGEPVGWDTPSYDEPPYDPDDYLYDPDDETDDDYDDFEDDPDEDPDEDPGPGETGDEAEDGNHGAPHPTQEARHS